MSAKGPDAVVVARADGFAVEPQQGRDMSGHCFVSAFMWDTKTFKQCAGCKGGSPLPRKNPSTLSCADE
jgi:hypothetical protein